MIVKLSGCLGTGDLKPHEEEFVEKLVRIKDSGQVTALSGPQVEWLSDLHDKHFG
jgi:hypothetical protein